MIDFLKDFDPWLIEPDGFLYAMAVLLSGAVYFGSPILQRLVATFPAMRRPLAPVLRRDPPRHVIRTANVRPVVPKLVQRYWSGDHARLIERLPPAVEALLSDSEKDERLPVIDVTPPREVELAMIQPKPEAASPSPIVLSSAGGSVSPPPVPDIKDNRPVQVEPKLKAYRTPLERKPTSGASLTPVQPKGKLIRPGKRRDPSIESA